MCCLRLGSERPLHFCVHRRTRLADYHGACFPSLEELAGSVSSALAGSVVQCDFPGQTAHISREPYGVVLAIVPWNAPLILATRACATPIIAGNTCVLKTSEFSPVSNTIIAQVFAEAGLPKGVLNVIHVDAKDSPKAGYPIDESASLIPAFLRSLSP